MAKTDPCERDVTADYGEGVSPEMIAAGVRVLVASGRLYDDREYSGDKLIIEEIWRAMYSRRNLRSPKR